MRKLLLFALLLAVTGLWADGVQPDGSGAEDDPYQVATLDNLLWVSTNDSSWTSHFVQTADIDATDTQNWNDGEGFSPIGIEMATFTGAYNGQMHVIDDLYINRPSTYYQAFLGNTAGAIIENLGITNVDVTGYYCTGGLIGASENSIISNCYSTGSMSGNFDTGGLVGLNGDNSTVSNCYSTGSVNGEYDVGGLVGWNSESYVNNCYSTGSVNGVETVGGLVAWNDDSYVSNCYCTGSVNGVEDVGGLVGFTSTSVNNCFWDTETSGQSSSADGTGKTTAEMQDVATYTSLATPGLDSPWDFIGNPFDDIGNEDYWDIDGTTNSGYPFLTDVPVGIDDDGAVPEPISAITLHPAFPNPFNPTTTIKFSVAKRQSATLKIFNLRGQLVKSYPAFAGGNHEVVWDGADNSGRGVASGVYLYRLQSDSAQQVRKMALLK
ncbi:MAG: T9SS type A sorting domain-containing protein [Candidatus Cloacimonetes bacterium]|nr:T9SS type A sorting domain-containing protein [Candidatus Cloacimonadota bacterium]